MKKNNILVPLTVPSGSHKTYIDNFIAATHGSGRLFLMAGDQKIEHLNADFYGNGASSDSANPEHLFKIASNARIGVFATQLGLIARYGASYKKPNYVVKLNSKTNLIPTKQADPKSLQLHSVEDVIAFKDASKLNIVGVGYTVYLGSEHEALMLNQAAQAIFHAHQHGLLAVVWMYPRGKAVPNERDADLIAGAAGVGACLGADFVKVNPPEAKSGIESAELLTQATKAAGRSNVICSGGKAKDAHEFLADLHAQIHIGGAQGCATGRNIHHKSFEEAINFCEAIATIVIDNKDVKDAKKCLK